MPVMVSAASLSLGSPERTVDVSCRSSFIFATGSDLIRILIPQDGLGEEYISDKFILETARYMTRKIWTGRYKNA